MEFPMESFKTTIKPHLEIQNRRKGCGPKRWNLEPEIFIRATLPGIRADGSELIQRARNENFTSSKVKVSVG